MILRVSHGQRVAFVTKGTSGMHLGLAWSDHTPADSRPQRNLTREESPHHRPPRREMDPVAGPGRDVGGSAEDDELAHDMSHVTSTDSIGSTERPREMGKVIVMNHVTLDGVMQGPGRADEDTREGFEEGGWAASRGDESMVAKMGERMGNDRAFLFGRRTYEDLLASWNARGGPFMEALNSARKYVASSNPEAGLAWPNSTLLHGDIPASVADLRKESATNLVIMGSGVLISSLMAADLIDEYLLMIHPLVLGTGRRLFAGGTHASLRLVESSTTTTGVLIAIYAPARPEE